MTRSARYLQPGEAIRGVSGRSCCHPESHYWKLSFIERDRQFAERGQWQRLAGMRTPCLDPMQEGWMSSVLAGGRNI